jgi:phosphatidylinositol alpha-1,6-mannosyltransferase
MSRSAIPSIVRAWASEGQRRFSPFNVLLLPLARVGMGLEPFGAERYPLPRPSTHSEGGRAPRNRIGIPFASMKGARQGDVPNTLVVANDYPPRVGGAQQYVWNLVRNLPPDRITVLAPNHPGWREHDTGEPYPIHRWPSTTMWPTRELALKIRSLSRIHGAEVVLFGHGLLPVIGPSLADWGMPYVSLTHGWEVWLARVPGIAGVMRRGLRGAHAVTAVSRYTGTAIRRSLGLSRPLAVVHPGVDPERFAPGVDGSHVRERHGLSGAKVVLCVSRLVPRKGQDVLIRAMKLVRRHLPDAVLLLVGDGPDGDRLRRLARSAPPGSVVFAGEVPEAELPAHYAACDVFAMPCRSRWGGLEVEGFGIVYLEAAATGRPVVAGRSGGASEAVDDQQTGLMAEATEPKAVGLALFRLLEDRQLAGRLGDAGRRRVEAAFTWERQAGLLADILRSASG